jgi:hypothetical protein
MTLALAIIQLVSIVAGVVVGALLLIWIVMALVCELMVWVWERLIGRG